jgi:hypothetical protein
MTEDTKVVKAAVDGLIDTASKSVDAAITAIDQFKDMAVEAGHGVIRVGDTTAEQLIQEAYAMNRRLAEILKTTASAVTEPLP